MTRPDKQQLGPATDGKWLLQMAVTFYLASGDGSQPQKLVSVKGTALDPRFSPDGRRLRFDVTDPTNGSSALWEVNHIEDETYSVLDWLTERRDG
jgi:Tol biopolymer transport system component